MTAKTPVFQLEYIVEGEPIREARLALENNAKTIEAALVAGGVAPPAAQDMVALVARINALESPVRAGLTSTAIQNNLAAGWRSVFLGVGAIDSHNGRQTDGTWVVPAGLGGTYEIDGAVAIAPSVAGQPAGSRILVNGAVYPGCLGAFMPGVPASQGVYPLGTRNKVLIPGDKITLQGYSNTANWATGHNNDTSSFLTLRRISS
jgi:hypothetical protein